MSMYRLSSTTGAPSAAGRVELCCVTSGPFERLSTAVLSDGSFDFYRVPPGRYKAVLRGKKGQIAAEILNPSIEISDQDKSGVLLVSAPRVASVSATITWEGGTGIPSGAAVKVSLVISPAPGAQTTAAVSIPMNRMPDETYFTPFASGVPYTISVENIPEGYKLKSISGSGAPSAVPTAAADGGIRYSGFAPGIVSIVLQRTPPQ